jgi:hypothetical protein
MKRLAFLGAVVALLTGMSPSHAEVFAQPKPFDVGLPSGAHITVDFLATFQSQPNEDKVAFMKRVGSYLQAYAANNAVEACGNIWANAAGNAWVVPVVTLHSHFHCEGTTLKPDGETWAKTGETIHVHPMKRSAVASATDAALDPHLTQGTHVDLLPRTFSQGDLAEGPGYLVANGTLQYQREGGRVEQDLGTIPVAP